MIKPSKDKIIDTIRVTGSFGTQIAIFSAPRSPITRLNDAGDADRTGAAARAATGLAHGAAAGRSVGAASGGKAGAAAGAAARGPPGGAARLARPHSAPGAGGPARAGNTRARPALVRRRRARGAPPNRPYSPKAARHLQSPKESVRAMKRTPCAILQASLLYCWLILSFGCASSILGCRLSRKPNALAAQNSQYDKGCSWHTSAIFFFSPRRDALLLDTVSTIYCSVCCSTARGPTSYPKYGPLDPTSMLSRPTTGQSIMQGSE